jgi:FtsP/CotA-like multicopper oxidase with cupredoxin domain
MNIPNRKQLTIASVAALVIGGGLLLWRQLQTPPYVPAPPTKDVTMGQVEPPCQDLHADWRPAQVIDDVTIDESPGCEPDNPALVAAVVKGTNNVSHTTLMQSGLAMDAVVLEDDRDQDGDPDVVHIRLEVAELNGRSPEVEFPVPSYPIAPGILPGLWAFVPKPHGMATKDIISMEAAPLLRLPSPTIRVEAGDTVRVTLENTHFLPHTIHFHGVDHPYFLDNPLHGEHRGNDGVPETSHSPTLPGTSFTYELTPRQTGTMLYHCHEQPPVHVMMGLMGMFVVEENRPDNWVQTLNVGAGQVRHPAAAIKERFASEHDLMYQEVDRELGDLIKTANDPRLIGKVTTSGYDVTKASSEYFLLNGHSFPYTLRDSLIIVEPNQKVKLRMANGGDERSIAIHTHGHKLAISHYDGIEQNPTAWITRDVFDLAPAQRLDLVLDTTDDGLHSYGQGAWMFHDHREKAITNDGVFPGGNVSLIVYKRYLGAQGLPSLSGVSLKPFFTKEFYRREFPVWATYDQARTLVEPEGVAPSPWGLMSLAFLAGLALGGVGLLGYRLGRRRVAP